MDHFPTVILTTRFLFFYLPLVKKKSVLKATIKLSISLLNGDFLYRVTSPLFLSWWLNSERIP